METLIRNLKILLKSDRMLAEIKLKLVAQKIVLFVLAGLAVLFALGMLNLSVFFAIQETLGPAIAALLVSLGNLLLAGILLLVVQRLDTGPEAKLVEEVREMALADIEAEAKAFQSQLRLVRDEIADMRSGITKLVKNPMEALTPRLLLPAIAAVANLVTASGKSASASPNKTSSKPRPNATRRKAAPARATAAQRRAQTKSKRTQAAPQGARKTT
jgi:hypothetical protein